MKTIKINFVGFWGGFNYKESLLYKILTKHYNVMVCEDCDYIICSALKPYTYLKYPQVRIMFSGENYIPDFNLVDYGISVYPLKLFDRHFQMPCVSPHLYDLYLQLETKERNYSHEILTQKPYFANLINSHDSEYNFRSEFFKGLSHYKRIEAPGKLCFNMPKNIKLSREDGSKFEFLKKCKFTLCFESTNHQGFVTEKIAEAFLGDTIPIYFGSDYVKTIFNKNAFVYISSNEDISRAIRQIIELDKDDDKYLEMLRQPILNNPSFYSNAKEDYEKFLLNIFDQDLNKVSRRSKMYCAATHEKYINQRM